MKYRTKISARLLGTYLALPVVLLIISTYITNCAYLLLAITQTVLFITYFSGYWEFFGASVRKMLCALLEWIFVVVLVYKIFNNGFGNGISIIPFVLFFIVELYLLYELVKILIPVFKKEKSAVEIEFPFKDGMYIVSDGNFAADCKENSPCIFAPYAVDLVRVEKEGGKWLPVQNESYPVFKENVYSPLDGVVFKVVDGMPDNKPFSGEYPEKTANSVVVKKGDYYLLLSSFSEKSIAVKEGDKVNCGDLIGTAGNSGISDRPHLRMRLVKSDSEDYSKGTELPVMFKNKNLYKNRVVKN